MNSYYNNHNHNQSSNHSSGHNNNSSMYSRGAGAGAGGSAQESGYRGGGGAGDKKQNRRMAQEELTQKKMEKETEYFWTLVERNKKQSNRRINSNGSGSGEEKKLFGAQGNAGIKFDSYESIPVEKSGPHADAAPPMNSFDELIDSLPEFMTSNLQRMKYDLPTPIQKYAIPLALLGHDLMCSAQTVLLLSFPVHISSHFIR